MLVPVTVAEVSDKETVPVFVVSPLFALSFISTQYSKFNLFPSTSVTFVSVYIWTALNVSVEPSSYSK